jgi:hypothetical protein
MLRCDVIADGTVSEHTECSYVFICYVVADGEEHIRTSGAPETVKC